MEGVRCKAVRACRLQELRNEYGIYVQRLLTYEYEGEQGALLMNRIMTELRAPLDSFADPRLRNASRIDYLNDDTGLPKSDVLSFELSPSDKVIVRPSGTEPKLKAYLFTNASSEDAAEHSLDLLQELVDSIADTKKRTAD